MSFAAPELIKSKPQTCLDCGVKVVCGRTISWDYNFCPKCYESEKNRAKFKINPLLTKTKPAEITHMTLYLNLYTPIEMENMK